MYQYTLSQPINMNLLIEKYYSIIYPYYLFLLKSEKEDNKGCPWKKKDNPLKDVQYGHCEPIILIPVLAINLSKINFKV